MPTFDPSEIELVAPPPPPGGGPGGGPPGDGPKPPPGDGPKPPGGGDPKDEQPGPEIDIDKIHKEVEDKMARREEIGTEEELKQKDQSVHGAGKKATGQPGTGGAMDLQSREQEIVQIKPKFNWKTLIKNLVTASVPQTDISYAKPSRRAVTGIAIAAQTGAGALKPGEKTLEENKAKLVFVFDTSGSMGGEVPRVMAEVRNLLKQLGKQNVDMGVVFFAGEHKSFVVNMGADTYAQVADITDIGKPIPKGDAKKGYRHVFSLQASGGTQFKVAMSNQLSELAAQGYNILLFSDLDIVSSSNFVNVKHIWQNHKDKLFLVAVDEPTFKAACNLLGVVPRTFTYLT
jgi:hypothetical protein